MAQAVLNPTDWDKMVDIDPTGNYHTDHFASGFYSLASAVGRDLIKFDLTSIPAGSTITSANLQLYDRADVVVVASNTMRFYPSVRAWNGSQATWNVYTTGNNWGTAGSGNSTTDYIGASELGNVAQPAPAVLGYTTITFSTSVLATLIPGGGTTNNGFFFRSDTESGSMSIHNYDSGSDSNLPILTINYTPPGPAGVKTWDGLAIASVKTINGLATSSIKSINGIT